MSDYGLSGSTSTVSKGNSAQRKNQQDRGRRFSGASWRKRKGAKTSIDKNAKAKARDLRRVLLKKKEVSFAAERVPVTLSPLPDPVEMFPSREDTVAETMIGFSLQL